jgi:hypothetical protein
MKKEYLDFLYDLRNKAQIEIDKLVMEKSNPVTSERSIEIQAELRIRRLQIYDINNSINKYLELY